MQTNQIYEQFQQKNECIFCDKTTDNKSLASLMKEALNKKYFTSQINNDEKIINKIMGQQNHQQSFNYYDLDYIRYKEWQLVNEDCQFLKRYYFREQYGTKMGIYSHYYMLYKDFPRIHLRKIEKIMQKYRDSKRKYQYKKQIGEQNSCQTYTINSEMEANIKSQYSNFLTRSNHQELQKTFQNIKIDNSDSLLLRSIIQEIDKADLKVDRKQIKGRFYFNKDHFDKFIERQEIKKKQKLKISKKEVKKILQKKSFNYLTKSLNQKLATQKKSRRKNTKFIYNNKLEIRNIAYYRNQRLRNETLEESVDKTKKLIDQNDNKTPHYHFLKKRPTLFQNNTKKVNDFKLMQLQKYGHLDTNPRQTSQIKSVSKQKKGQIKSKRLNTIKAQTSSVTKLVHYQYEKNSSPQKLKMLSNQKNLQYPILRIRSFSSHHFSKKGQISNNIQKSAKKNRNTFTHKKMDAIHQVITKKLTIYQR